MPYRVLMRKSVFVSLLAVFAILFLVALIALCVINPLLHSIIENQARLKPGSVLFQQWSKPSVPIYLQFYFFNLTNPAEFRDGAKPVVKQQGPYTYRERPYKTGLHISDADSTIRYDEVKEYFFVRNLSIGPESDMISSINLVYLTIANQLSWMPSWAVRLIELAERQYGDQLIARHNVSEWLWGYKDPFLTHIEKFIPLNISVIGLYYGKNNTADGPYVIDDGLSNRTQLGRILSYRGQSSMSCWTTASANAINGSDGSLFHSFLGLNESFFVFATDICRSLEFTPRDWGSIFGIPARKYLPLEDTFDSPKLNPKNRGFCPHWPDCFETGVLDMSSCQPGAPIAVSMPHFVHADQTYQDGVIGLHPSEEFNTTFHIEPRTGVILSATRKLQINANVTRNSKFRGLANLSTVLLPIIFVNESVTVDEYSATLLRWSLDVVPLIASVIASLLLVSAFIVITISTIKFVRGEQEPDAIPTETSPLLS